MSDTTASGVVSPPDAQVFKLVDSRVQSSSEGGCGCGGKGGCGGKKKTVDPGDATQQEEQKQHRHRHGHSGGGCGCGGHGRKAQNSDHSIQEAHQHMHSDNEEVEELRVYELPHVVRKQLLLYTADILPVNKSVIVVTHHQPDALFEHLQQSEFHYRVQTRESGPTQWSYQITRVS